MCLACNMHISISYGCRRMCETSVNIDKAHGQNGDKSKRVRLKIEIQEIHKNLRNPMFVNNCLNPWMTLNCCKVKFSWNFATFLVFRPPLIDLILSDF